jgi:hypothetical protein
MHSRHLVRLANDMADPEQVENDAAVISDCVEALRWLAADPTRMMVGQEWVDWTHERKWTGGHRKAVALLVREELVNRCEETKEQARARLIIHTNGVYRDARLSGDYSPAVAALKIQWDKLVPDEAPAPAAVNINLTHYVVRLPEKARTVEEWEEQAAKALPPPK